MNFYINGRPRYQEVDRAALLDLLMRYGYEVPDNATDQQQQRVITAFQMHYRPQVWNGVADVETMAIAEALLEKYGQGKPSVFARMRVFPYLCLRLILSTNSIHFSKLT